MDGLRSFDAGGRGGGRWMRVGRLNEVGFGDFGDGVGDGD